MDEPLLKIKLLGGVSLTIDDVPIANLPTRKAEALLVYLVCRRRPVSREVLAELLWDERSQEQGLANLRSILSSLQKQLKPYLLVTRQTIAFNHASNYWLDVVAFEAHVNSAREDAALRAAAELYQGDFLEGFYLRESAGFEEWALLERERVQRLAVTLFWRLIDATCATGDYQAGLRYVDQLLRADNLSERAHRQKMMLLARTGQYNAAVQHFDHYCRLMHEEMGASPEPDSVALAGQIRAAREVRPPHLPPPPPHYVGRSQQQAELLALLRNPSCRLVTVLGVGGMGKTRLATESVRYLITQQPGQFLHGVCYVALADLDDVRLLPARLADALGAAPAEQEMATQQLAEFLRDKEMLLVLDNFEPLLEAAAWLGDLLAAAPQVKALVTSQEPLHLHEEWLFDLDGLATPAHDLDTEAAAIMYAAPQLFLQIAQRLHTYFQPTATDIAAICQVCRALRGMPLGIELAAVWIRQFTAAQIAEEIGRGLDFLTTNVRNLPERHRSLRAAFDYAWRRLKPDERGVFARLSLFHGGFTFVAATAVAAATAQQLAALVEKSLLQHEGDRYDIHPMLARFAGEQLGGDNVDDHTRHAVFYLSLLTDQHPGESAEQRRVIQTELPNIRAAWQWAVMHQRSDLLLRPTATLHNFYSAQSWFREGIDAFRFALDHLNDAPDDDAQLARMRCELLTRLARMRIHIGELESASRALDAAMQQAQRLDDPAALPAILGSMAITAYYAGEVARAINLIEQSLALDEVAGEMDGVGFALNFLGSCHKARGDYDLAEQCFLRSEAVYNQLGDELAKAMTLNNLGNLAQARGDFSAAHDYYLTCSRLFQKHDHVHGAATTLANAGRLARKLGNLDEAAELLQASLTLKREMQDNRGVAVALIGLADVAAASVFFSEAHSYLAEGMRMAQQVGEVKLMLEGLAVWGSLRLQEESGTIENARLLAFVAAHPATAQEVRDQASQALAALPSPTQKAATAWAGAQRLDKLVAEALRSL